MSSSGNRFRQVLFQLLIVAGAVTGVSAILASCSGAPQDSEGSLDSPRVEAVAAQGWELIKMNSYNYADTQLDSFGHFTTTPNGCHQDAEGAIQVALWNQIAPVVNNALSKPLLSTDNEACFPRPDGSKLYGTVDIVVDPPAPQSRRAEYAADTEPQPHPWPSWLPNPFAPSTPDPTPTVTVTVTPTPHPISTSTATPAPTSTSTSHPFPTPTWSSHPGPSPSWSAGPSPSPSPSGITKTLFENNGDQICTTIQDTTIAQQLLQQLDQVSAIAYKEDCPQAQ